MTDPPPVATSTEPPRRDRPTTPTRYGSAMLRRFGWFHAFMGFGRMFRRLRLEEHSVENIRSAAQRGPVVYVLHHQSTVDHLALNALLNQRRLPLSVWGNGTTSFYWQPVAAAWADVARRVRSLLRDGPAPDPVKSGWVARVVAAGEPVTFFLQTRATPWQWLRGTPQPDMAAALLGAQQLSSRPIQLVPVLVVWDRAPEVRHSQVRRFLLGNRAPQGIIADLRNVYLRSREAFIQVGEAVDLAAFTARVEPVRQAKALRTLLRRYLRRESTVVRGPRLLGHRVMKKIVLDNPPMRELARREAAALGQPVGAIERRMSKDFDSIAANFKWWVIRVLHLVLRPLWTRVFSGVDVRDEDMDRIRTAMRKGTAVLVPSHKSHFDYVLLSWVFFQHNLIVPHIVAGMNLAIWPVSILLRGAGAFFIKRSFAGERIFPTVFSRYLRELVRQGYPIEFFIEGGRTRSGKLLPPRVGVLGMVLEAAEMRPSGREVTLLPMSLAYEQVAEEQVYARELEGEKKRPESMGQLVRARAVLRRRFGRVYLRVGEPIQCSEIVDASQAQPPWSQRSTDSNREVLYQLGQRVLYRISRATIVLPQSLVALALLAHNRRGIRQSDLLARIARFRAFLGRWHVEEAASLAHYDQAINQALDRFLRGRLIDSFNDGERVWSITPERRITLEFYKNQILWFFAAAGFAAGAIRALPPEPFAFEDVRQRFLFLLWTMRREFTFDPDQSATTLLRDALDALVAHGALRTRDDRLMEVHDATRMEEIYVLIRNLLESYALVLRATATLERHRVDARGLATLLQSKRDPADDDVTLPEALSLVSLGNAIGAFVEEGVLTERDGVLAFDEALRQQRMSLLEPMVA